MRIALIAPPWLPVPPPAYGGTESVIDRLACGFARRGHDVLLCTTGDATAPVPKHWTFESAQHHRIGSSLCELVHLLDAYDAARDYDIVHDHTIVGPLYAHRYGLPVVTTNHGPFDDELRSLYRRMTNAAIVAISQHHAGTADSVPIRAVIHHGLDPEAFPVGRGDGGYFAFIGRMVAEKGVREAIDAARAAGVPLKLAAKMREPEERQYFDETVRPVLGDGIEYIGEVGVDDKAEFLGAARAVLNPIQWPEPFGLVMIEALACGTPVLAHPRGAAPEIVDHGTTGFLCRDHDDMVRRISDVERLDRQACRAAVEERFSTARMVEDHIGLYERVLAETGAPQHRSGSHARRSERVIRDRVGSGRRL